MESALTAYIGRGRVPRSVHPLAWWVWALGLAVAASRTTNPWLLIVIVLVAGIVVLARRSDLPWAMSFRLYLVVAAIIVAVRVSFRVIFGASEGGIVVIGIHLFGDISATAVVAGLLNGMQLGAMVVCVGAANSLANPKKLLKAMPSALYEVGTSMTVAVSVFPQLAESVGRVRRARLLRGGTKPRRFAMVHSTIVPVLEDALDRSISLAASMDSRGYGRSGAASPRARFITGALMLIGLTGLCIGSYGVLDGTSTRWLAGPMLAAGAAIALTGFALAGRGVHRSTYRPDPWGGAEVVTAASGIAAGGILWAGRGIDPRILHPVLDPLTWPQVTWLPLIAVLLAALPAICTPAPPLANSAQPPS